MSSIRRVRALISPDLLAKPRLRIFFGADFVQAAESRLTGRDDAYGAEVDYMTITRFNEHGVWEYLRLPGLLSVTALQHLCAHRAPFLARQHSPEFCTWPHSTGPHEITRYRFSEPRRIRHPTPSIQCLTAACRIIYRLFSFRLRQTTRAISVTVFCRVSHSELTDDSNRQCNAYLTLFIATRSSP